jgi:hypothetical protein
MLGPLASAATDWIQASTSVVLVFVAVIGFGATIYSITQTRNRQEVEIEGYIRVDVGPEEGTDDYAPPSDIIHVDRSNVHVVGEPREGDPMIVAWYRNLQTHSLGIALGVKAVISGEVIDVGGTILTFKQEHEIAYVEPGKCVQVNVLRFPTAWKAQLRVDAVQYRNHNWDGKVPRHGRRECTYEDGHFQMVPWSNPPDPLLTKWRRSGE